ncbi:hypothetical protein D3C81_2245580 [compost metagenome]
MIFLGPVEHRIHNKTGHHGALGGHIIAAARAIGQTAIPLVAQIIAGNQLGEIYTVPVIDMVIDYIHDDA